MRVPPARARRLSLALGALPLALAALPACAVPPEAGFPDVARVAAERTGHAARWRRDPAEAAAIDRIVQDRLSRELTADAAVEVALLNNRALQARYEELGVAQADVVQAGLLRNPEIGATLRFPLGGGAPGLDLGVEQDFLSLLFLSARRDLAQAEMDRVKLEVGDAVVALAAEARAAFLAVQAAAQIAALRRVVTEAAQASVEIARRQQEAGTLSDLDLAAQEAEYEEVKLSLARSGAELGQERERLARTLGLWGPAVAFRVAPKLPDPPAAEPPLDAIERLAVTRRLDLAAARRRTENLERALDLARSGRWTGALTLGAEAEREGHDGSWSAGPHVGVELPIFDQGQAGIARLEAERRQAEHALAALAVEVRSEVRAARDRVLFARSVADRYRAVIIPLRERLVALHQEQYDAMLIGVYQLLTAKAREVETYQEYIEAVRDYWIARTELERATGGRLPTPRSPLPAPAPAPAPASAPAPAPAPAPPHQHHR